MKKTRFLAFLPLALMFCAVAWASEAGVVREYDIVSEKDGEKIGSRRVAVYFDVDEGAQVVEEEASMVFRDMEVGWKTKVLCDAETSQAMAASVSTSVRGAAVMEAEVTFDERGANYSGRFLADKKGRPLDEPKRTFSGGSPLDPGATVVFVSTVQEIGPRLAAWPDKPVEIVFGEMPDDIDEPVKFKEGYKLLREEAEDRSFTLEVLDRRDKPVMTLEYDQFGVCRNQTLDKFSYRLVE